MSTLRVETGGRSYTFEEPRVVTIGRAPENEIVLPGAAASRRHAEIRSEGNGWSVVDVGSSSGTFVNGTRVSEVRVSGPTSVRFGSADGDEMTLVVEGAAQQPPFPAPTPPAAGAPVNLQQTVLPGSGPAPGAPGPYGAVTAGPGILVRIGNESKRFAAGTTVRIGRDPASEVVVDDPSVSRLHATLEMRGRDWWYVDRSTAGTFDEEDRVTQRKLGDEPTILMLGHPTAGVEVELVPIVAAGEAQRALASKKRKRTALVLAAVVAAVVLIAGGIGAAFWLGGDDSSSSNDAAAPPEHQGLSQAALDRAKQATVLIIALDGNGEVLGKGSGSIISPDGKILTVAHVGDPHAPGALFPDSDPAPAAYQIALTSPEDDKPADPEYTAVAVASDGPLDLTIMQITGDADGNPIDPATLKLPAPLPIGDSDAVRTGDNVTALGFPGVAHVATTESFTQNALTVTRGVVSTFLGDEPIDDERAWIDSDVRIGSGNSGGPSINDDGEIIGLNDNVVTEGTVGKTGAGGSFTGGSARIRPVNFAQGILDAADSGTDYVSPYLDSMEQMPTDVPSSATITSAGWSPDGKGNCQGTSSLDDPQAAPKNKVPAGSTIYAEYAVSGVEDGTPLSVTFYAVDGRTELGSLEDRWSFGTDDTCITVPFTLAKKLPGVIAELTIGSVVTDNPLVFQ
jgi:putative serine protease PepD